MAPAILIMFVCINQGLGSQACVHGTAELYSYENMDVIAKKINDEYLKPLPSELKDSALAGDAIYKRQVSIPVTKHISTSYRLNTDNTSTTGVNLNWTFQ